jgi:LysR family transcriptional activator of nhaA
MATLNYRHLRYFWTVAKAGGVGRAAKQLYLTPQSISGQLRVLEDSLGQALFQRAGRSLELTDAGRLVMSYADEIFSLGGQLQEQLHRGGTERMQLFRVGVGDMMSKSVAYQLLEPALRLPEPVRIVCREWRLTDLLAELAVERLELVIADRPMPSSVSVRAFNHLLGECGVTFFCERRLAQELTGSFPRCLNGAPLLLPGEDAAARPRFMQWLDQHRLHPRIVGEFDDPALLSTFGHAGAGVFAMPSVLAKGLARERGLVAIGATEDVIEQFYAISVERRITHPAVVAVWNAARRELFVRSRRSNVARKRAASKSPATPREARSPRRGS